MLKYFFSNELWPLPPFMYQSISDKAFVQRSESKTSEILVEENHAEPVDEVHAKRGED